MGLVLMSTVIAEMLLLVPECSGELTSPRTGRVCGSAVPEPAPFSWAGELSRAPVMLGGPRAVFRSTQRVMKPVRLQLVRQAWTGGFGAGLDIAKSRTSRAAGCVGLCPGDKGGSGSLGRPG